MDLKAGLDIGSSSVKIVILDSNNETVYRSEGKHFGNPAGYLKDLFMDFQYMDVPVKLCGCSSERIFGDEYLISDVPALKQGAEFLFGEIGTIFYMGAEHAGVIGSKGRNMPPEMAFNSSCSGGTGSFFESQMYRLGCSIEDYSKLSAKSNQVLPMSGRCSVFAKTDIIHRQQEGCSVPDILNGLCYAAVRNYKVTVLKNITVKKPVVFCGGVARNTGVCRAFMDIFSLNETEFLYGEDSIYASSYGAAINCENDSITFKGLSGILDKNLEKGGFETFVERLPKLEKIEPVKVPLCNEINEQIHLSLGVDVGSTSVNLVLTDSNGNLYDYQYLRTLGDPEGQVKKGMLSIKERFGDKVIIDRIGVTGSGRYFVGKKIGADIVRDEITAQTACAVAVNPDTDTIFEIGGQDSKYISVNNSVVRDFTMNRICAAGTGSFIEEQASEMGIKISDYGKIALESQRPVDLGERCTVFVKSKIAACMALDIDKSDILAGICYSVIRNYLFKVVENRKVGDNIMLQGGVCYNPAVIAAFKSYYGEKVTVNPYFPVSGAYGVALIAGRTGETGEVKETETDALVIKEMEKQKIKPGSIEPRKKTVGIPMVLMNYHIGNFIKIFFEKAGYNCLFSESTIETVRLAQQYAKTDCCYPVKLIYGHMAWLRDHGADYIFLPRVETMKHSEPGCPRNFGCMYMQSAAETVFNSLELEKDGIELLSPVFYMSNGMFSMKHEMMRIGKKAGIKRNTVVKVFGEVIKEWIKKEQRRKETVRKLKKTAEPGEKRVVLICRPYDALDPVLNMGIPEEFRKRGYTVISQKMIVDPNHYSLYGDYDNMYWPFGKHVIKTARAVAEMDNTYAVYITNHGCGPDSMLQHFVIAEMGDKPYLHIEVDEHVSRVGVITRIEAFINSIESHSGEGNETHPECKTLDKIEKEKDYSIPNLPSYSLLFSKIMNQSGWSIKPLEPTSDESIKYGREAILSKEYFSFTNVIGSCIKGVKDGKVKNLLLPETLGSETDGTYGMAVRSIINSSDVTVTTFMLEKAFAKKWGANFFLSLLAGDIYNLLREADKVEFMAEEQINKKVILKYAERIGNYKNVRKRIFVLGEPSITYNNYLNNNLLNTLSKKGYSVKPMALSEYVLFLWKRTTFLAKDRGKIAPFVKLYDSVRKLEGKNTNMLCVKSLTVFADEKAPHLTGGNIAYRYARIEATSEVQAEAIIHVASMYENAGNVFEGLTIKNEMPILNLHYDDRYTGSVKESLESFIYYL